jgi:very-short-patch-repair endonuclease
MSISDHVSMFYNAKPHIFEKAKMLRKNMTEAEKKLWELLRNKKMLNMRFRPQHPIDIFIADFYCHSLKLVVEVDGGIHKASVRREYDLGRESELNKWGIKVIRLNNEEIEKDINFVMLEIERICAEREAELQSPLQGI